MDTSRSAVSPSAAEIIPPILVGMLILLAVLLVASLLVIYLGRWAKSPASAPLASVDLLSQFRLLYEQGECSQEEYDRIRAKLGKRLKDELKNTAKPADAPPSVPASDRIRLPADPAEPRIGPATGPNDSGPSIKPAGDASD